MTAQPPVPGNDPDSRGDDRDTLAWALHRLAVAGAAMDTVLAGRLGLSSTEYVAMKHVSTADPPIGPVELGRLLGISSGSATALVDRLEQAGHLQRTRHPVDRRRLVLTPTNKAASQLLTELYPLAEDIEHLGAGFTATERDVVTTFLTQAAEIYTRHGGTERRSRRRQ